MGNFWKKSSKQNDFENEQEIWVYSSQKCVEEIYQTIKVSLNLPFKCKLLPNSQLLWLQETGVEASADQGAAEMHVMRTAAHVLQSGTLLTLLVKGIGRLTSKRA